MGAGRLADAKEQIMSATGSDVEGQTSHLSRTPATIAAIICGIMAAVGIAAAIYADINTPEIHDVQIYNENHVLRTESKGLYLFAPIVFLVLLFVILAYYALRWSRFARRSEAIEKFYKARFEILKVINLSVLFKIVFASFCVFQAGALLQALYRCGTLLNKSF
jgi:hypothetical protein